jgi:hemerythrin
VQPIIESITMLLHWNTVYETGHKKIDEQHKMIIVEMNRLHEYVSNHEDEDKIKQILKFLNHYVNEHFSFEEGCFEKYKCPFAEKNRTEHKDFTDKVKELNEAAENEVFDHAKILDIYYEMVFWIKDHILETDVPGMHCKRDQLEPGDRAGS